MNDRDKAIAKNSVLLYVRMAIVMIVNLFVIRLVLLSLGKEDYGIYNVVAGIVTTLSSVNYVLSSATQRFYSYSLGKNDNSKLSSIFSSSMSIYIVFALFVIVLGETVGLWFINNKLVIPIERLVAANWVYQFSIASFVVSIITVPYSAAVFAHEDMTFYAIVSLFDCFARLVMVGAMSILTIDHLSYYGLVLLITSSVSFFVYLFWSRAKYAECQYKLCTDIKLYKELFSFSGWTLFGSLAGTGMNQVNTILTNIFFGPIVNAARAIAYQVSSIINTFSNSFVTAIRPPMVKAYSSGENDYLMRMFSLSNKFIYYSLLVLFLPIFFEIDTILYYWLKSTDAQTILFSRLILVYSLVYALHNPITIVVQATGRLRNYHLFVEVPTLLCMPVTYLLFKLGYGAEIAFWLMIIAICLSHIIRLLCLKQLCTFFNFRQYLTSFVLRALFVTLVVSSIVGGAHLIIDNQLLRLLIVLIVDLLITPLFSYFMAFDIKERKMLINTYRKTTKI